MTYYELKDHLGNVRVLFTKNGTDALGESYTDYYPGGMAMPGRNIVGDYRYGFQGQYSEKDSETGLNAFELRMYDSRIGRWTSPDPYGQFDSPYLAMGNNSVRFIDPDGGLCVDVNGNSIPCNDVFTGGENFNGPTKENLNVLDEVVVTASYSKNILKNGPSVIGNIDYASQYLGAGTNFSFLDANAGFDLNGSLALNTFAEATFFKEDASLRLGTEDNNAHGSGSFNFLTADAQLEGGVLTGNDNRYGLLGKGEAGAYVAKGELSGGFTILGIETDFTVGVSGLSAHAGVHGGVYYDDTTGKLVIKELAHLGFGVGAKEGINIAIPVSWLWE